MQPTTTTVGVLALQGGFAEHVALVRKAAAQLPHTYPTAVVAIEVRTPDELARCDALIIPGGESTTISFVAAQSGLLEPLREFVKYVFLNHSSSLLFFFLVVLVVLVPVLLVLNPRVRMLTSSSLPRVLKKPTWGTCAGLILLSEQANATKKGGQALIGGLDVRVHRNHFGRQIESFIAPLDLPFLPDATSRPFDGVFIRAPVVEALLSPAVAVVATLPDRVNKAKPKSAVSEANPEDNAGDIIAVRQGNVLGTSFHPELTTDARMHAWFLQEFVHKK
ncbi:Pyridoxal biosynthesis protein PDX2 [Beauveria bassiana D1-5]|uniref:glutaminase n=1 Tax=Beauveria bassiana D1-5 TaxID=1245745 RepID=A0A0A2VAX8_BEABA|nr:Pyridoxal biosynthesis protein PDX2 [Beauveria bassiana D1-5]